MSKSKIVAMMALIVLAMTIVLVNCAVAGERVKEITRDVYYAATVHTLKVPDVEGHTILLIEAKGIGFHEKWGASLVVGIFTMDLIKGEGTHQGYYHATFPDGSTFTAKIEGKNMGGGRGLAGSHSSEGTLTFIKGTGKFEGIQGVSTYKGYILGPGQWYTDWEAEYTLP